MATDVIEGQPTPSMESIKKTIEAVLEEPEWKFVFVRSSFVKK